MTKLYKRVVECPGEGWYIVQEIEEPNGRTVQTKFAGPFHTRAIADAILVDNALR